MIDIPVVVTSSITSGIKIYMLCHKIWQRQIYKCVSHWLSGWDNSHHNTIRDKKYHGLCNRLKDGVRRVEPVEHGKGGAVVDNKSGSCRDPVISKSDNDRYPQKK